MDLKEAKRVVTYAKRNGIKSMRLGDLEVTFEDPRAVEPKAHSVDVALSPVERNSKPAAPPVPTLQEIEDWIHSDIEESH